MNTKPFYRFDIFTYLVYLKRVVTFHSTCWSTQPSCWVNGVQPHHLSMIRCILFVYEIQLHTCCGCWCFESIATWWNLVSWSVLKLTCHMLGAQNMVHHKLLAGWLSLCFVGKYCIIWDPTCWFPLTRGVFLMPFCGLNQKCLADCFGPKKQNIWGILEFGAQSYMKGAPRS